MFFSTFSQDHEWSDGCRSTCSQASMETPMRTCEFQDSREGLHPRNTILGIFRQSYPGFNKISRNLKWQRFVHIMYCFIEAIFAKTDPFPKETFRLDILSSPVFGWLEPEAVIVIAGTRMSFEQRPMNRSLSGKFRTSNCEFN